ncbi:hypothetical protein GT037_004916 [Alternaria burnsii]|uniref:Uncharacterized protein n=1 Tax=Alternaria burnsii TaxID=1187904 RepID=A0A8H7EFH7_9PLEO|nr:uncharacterized protein GT037_004916 [Alternaria burnsii]KAF7676704.1 hypothetical protein GT037_004916 [Alternaria burnsii]
MRSSSAGEPALGPLERLRCIVKGAPPACADGSPPEGIDVHPSSIRQAWFNNRPCLLPSPSSLDTWPFHGDARAKSKPQPAAHRQTALMRHTRR